MWELDYKEGWAPKNWCFWAVVLEKTLQSPLGSTEIQPVHPKEISPGCSLEELCWSWNSSTFATWCKEMTHWRRPWCWEKLKAGGEGNDRGWDGWRASPTQWTWVWVNSRSWWWTGRPGVLQSMGSQKVGYDWVTELNRTEACSWDTSHNLASPNKKRNWERDGDMSAGQNPCWVRGIWMSSSVGGLPSL